MLQQSAGGIILYLTAFCLCCALCESSTSRKSCVSTCYDNQFPPCGVWLHEENSLSSSGIYQLGEGTVNLTCVVNSLPRPAVIDWQFRPQHDRKWSKLRCSSLRTVRDCKFNDIGEHRVTSSCMLKTTALAHTGAYRCSSVLERGDGENEDDDDDDSQSKASQTPTTSAETTVQVYGVTNLTVTPGRLHVGNTGSIEAELCANPKPNVMWVNRQDGTAVRSGQTIGRYVAFPLEDVSYRPGNDRSGPALGLPFCYKAVLFVSKVEESDNSFSITVANEGGTTTEDFKAKSAGKLTVFSWLVVAFASVVLLF